MADQGSVATVPQYGIDVAVPDVAHWAAGNTGLQYVWSFDSGVPGPHVAIQALTHGNEVCGAIALDFFLREAVRPVRGKLSLCFANVAAYRTWNPGEPFKSRFVDEDFNRVWGSAVLDGDRDSVELQRARELRRFYDTVDYLLDIHSMTDPCPPLMLAGARKKGADLALALGFPEHIVVDAGHKAGRRLRDYGRFDDPADPRTALLIECGQHWSLESPVVAIQASLRFLRHFGLIGADFIDRHLDPKPAPRQRIIEVTASVPIQTELFSFVWPQDGTLTVVPKAGTLVARDGEPGDSHTLRCVCTGDADAQARQARRHRGAHGTIRPLEVLPDRGSRSQGLRLDAIASCARLTRSAPTAPAHLSKSPLVAAVNAARSSGVNRLTLTPSPLSSRAMTASAFAAPRRASSVSRPAASTAA